MTSGARRFVVYGLVDPRDGSIRYIGRSNNPELRARTHWLTRDDSRVAGKARKAWLMELATAGFEPSVRILQESSGFDEIARAEVEWIERARSEGWPITNRHAASTGAVPREVRDERRFKKQIEEAIRRRDRLRWERKQPTPMEFEFVPGAARRLMRTLGVIFGAESLSEVAVRCVNAGVVALEDRYGFARNEEGEEPHA